MAITQTTTLSYSLSPSPDVLTMVLPGHVDIRTVKQLLTLRSPWAADNAFDPLTIHSLTYRDTILRSTLTAIDIDVYNPTRTYFRDASTDRTFAQSQQCNVPHFIRRPPR